jgi:hypothetical protein
MLQQSWRGRVIVPASRPLPGLLEPVPTATDCDSSMAAIFSARQLENRKIQHLYGRSAAFSGFHAGRLANLHGV